MRPSAAKAVRLRPIPDRVGNTSASSAKGDAARTSTSSRTTPRASAPRSCSSGSSSGAVGGGCGVGATRDLRLSVLFPKRALGSLVGRGRRAGGRTDRACRIEISSPPMPRSAVISSRNRPGPVPVCAKQRWPAVRGTRVIASSMWIGRGSSESAAAIFVARSITTSIALAGSSPTTLRALSRSPSRTPLFVSTACASGSLWSMTRSACAVETGCARL
jgi:hypothetical protein